MKTKKCIIKPEFRNADESDEVYLVVEDNGNRLLIRPEKWKHGKIIPQECVPSNAVIYIQN